MLKPLGPELPTPLSPPDPARSGGPAGGAPITDPFYFGAKPYSQLISLSLSSFRLSGWLERAIVGWWLVPFPWGQVWWWRSGWDTNVVCDIWQVTILLSSQKGAGSLDILQDLNNNNNNLCFELSESLKSR